MIDELEFYVVQNHILKACEDLWMCSYPEGTRQ
jgi:hypothetical protein